MEKKMIWSSEMLYDDEARENYLENMRAITENKDLQITNSLMKNGQTKCI